MLHSQGRSRQTSLRAVALAAVGALTAGLLTFFAPSAAQAAPLPSSILEGGYIISDEEFFDSDAMTAAEIQRFLDSKVATCRATTGPACLKDFRATTTAKAADKYCKAVPAATNLRASDIIARAAAACGINPQVILVMLQKEQGLVTSTKPSSWNVQQAMGQSCPDTAACDPKFAGFFNQVYSGARQMQVYTKNPTSFSYRAGRVNTIKWHPSSSCGTSKVYIQNQATANLYIYTPYRANLAALAAGYGTGDGCSAYGNRNFYNYYADWFEPTVGATTGAPAQVPACTVPASGDVSAGSGSATTKVAVKAQKAPTTKCTTGTTSLAAGAKVTVTGKYGLWSRFTSSGKTLWAPTAQLVMADTGAPAAGGNACAQPAASSVASASGTITVTTDALNARSAPSTACETGRTQLSKGTTAPRTATYGAWWRVTVSGAQRWIHSDYATVAPVATPKPTPQPTPTAKPTPQPTPKPTPKPTPTATPKPPVAKPVVMQTTAALNLRKGASTSAARITTLAKGTKVTISASSGAWRKVTVGSRTGWVDSRFLTSVPAAKPKPPATAPAKTTMQTTASLNLRASASTSARRITTLAKGTKVTVTASSGAWRKVTVGARTGWVDGRFLKASASKPVSTATKPTTKTTTAGLNLRASASTSARVLTVLGKGTKVTVTSVKSGWSQVKIGSRTGWVSTSFLR